MTFIRLLRRNLFYHWRGNLAVLLGVAVGTAVLTGALLVGDSLRGSLRDLARDQLGWVDHALVAGRFFRQDLASELGAGQITKTINNMLLWACMVANFESLSFAKKLGMDIPRLIKALGHGSGANWSLSRWGKSTGKWAEKDMDVALDLAQSAKMPMPLAGLVDQLVKHLNQERMKALMS